MTDASQPASAAKEINLRYQMVDGIMQIDIASEGLEDDPNLIAMHLALALDRMTRGSSSKI
jgi:hypothetical protein